MIASRRRLPRSVSPARYLAGPPPRSSSQCSASLAGRRRHAWCGRPWWCGSRPGPRPRRNSRRSAAPSRCKRLRQTRSTNKWLTWGSGGKTVWPHAAKGRGVSGRERPGKRTIVTLEEVARAAGVHSSTVSRALDPDTARQVNVVTRKRVTAVAKRMGYQKDMVASGLKRGRTHTVAVVVGDLGNPNTAPLLRGISNRLEAAGLMPLIVETQNDPARLERIVSHLLSRRVDAFILTAARLGDGPKLRRIHRHGIPVVLAVQSVPGIRLPAFTNDDILGGSLAAQHLLALGHRRVAQLRGPADIYSCLQRAQGFSQTIAAAGATEVVLRSTPPGGPAQEGYRP